MQSEFPVEAEYFTEDLPTTPTPGVGTVLVTGAGGYVGGRLTRELLHRGYQVRVLVRSNPQIYGPRWPGVEVVDGEGADPAVMARALRGVHTAYYLMHALAAGPHAVDRLDTRVARTFRQAAAACGVQHIIYLGGLGDASGALSRHLYSRRHVAEELASGPVPVTRLRAAIIIGSGSASYEIIASLAQRVRLIQSPRWLRTRCQPIAIRDVIKYLVGVLETRQAWGQQLDVGGPQILSYRSMLRRTGAIMGRRMRFVEFPWMSVSIYAYILGLFTPVPPAIIRSLLEGLKDEVVCQDDRVHQLISFPLLPFEEAVRRAMRLHQADAVETRWSSAQGREGQRAVRLHQLPRPPRYQDAYCLQTDCQAADLFRTIAQIGGDSGWFNSSVLWRIRGGIDRMLFGVGLSRGRRSRSQLRVGDVIDFWRVEDLQPDRRLLLRAEMKLPGKAWLEFVLGDAGHRRELRITAYDEPDAFWGHVYWWFFYPFHRYIFTDMMQQIEARSLTGQPAAQG